MDSKQLSDLSNKIERINQNQIPLKGPCTPCREACAILDFWALHTPPPPTSENKSLPLLYINILKFQGRDFLFETKTNVIACWERM